ncbi:MAG: acyl-CoA desaturase [Bacteroidetes bacterium]|nr:MAG: acyl-CoA desaturase [Bacteroidota bacterium]
MIFKTICMLSMYFVPYALLISAYFVDPLAVMAAWILMGVGMAGIGLSVMHDANHGSYSENKTVSKFIGFIIYLISGNRENWLIQHNRLHHTFTNVEGLDLDIDTLPILRFSPHQDRIAIHKYQHIFAWFLYSLLTVSWMTSKDFKQLYTFKGMGLIKDSTEFRKLMIDLVISKLIYYAFIIVIPVIFSAAPFWLTLLGLLSMHLIAGLILSCIFQLAHVMPSADFPEANTDGDLENNWAVHQLRTTCNFAPNSDFLNWYAGGLNFQVEHHLFPQICHVHYREISVIVEQTAKEFNLPYHSQKTFVGALSSHVNMLKKLGTED